MRQTLALRVLSEIMQWDDERARREFEWLRLMSRLKYDGYRDFLAGVRFVESLADWLQQFERVDRETAYAFVRQRLVYLGPAEMQHLVELVYPEHVQPRLADLVAERLGVPAYLLWSRPATVGLYRTLLRCTLFVGLSDGARIDAFRRANEGLISNEQVVVATQSNEAKWNSLLADLRKDLDDPTARFGVVYLLDDFVGSGTTLLRDSDGTWKGKLVRFWDEVHPVLDSHFEEDWLLCVHHYVGVHHATRALEERQRQAAAARRSDWFRRVEFSFTTVLPPDLPITAARDAQLMPLIDRYYDPAIETSHTSVGGTDVRLGFAGGALPLVLEHNTPNNSIALLWAETDGVNGRHAMRPLFRRRQRHT